MSFYKSNETRRKLFAEMPSFQLFVNSPCVGGWGDTKRLVNYFLTGKLYLWAKNKKYTKELKDKQTYMEYKKVKLTKRRWAYFGHYDETIYRNVSWYDESNVSDFLFPNKMLPFYRKKYLLNASGYHAYYEQQYTPGNKFARINRISLSNNGNKVYGRRYSVVKTMSNKDLYEMLKWNKVKGRSKLKNAGKEVLINAVMKID